MELETNKDVIKRIMTDKVLFKASMPDEDMAAFEAGTWEPKTDCTYLNYDNKAIVRLYPVTNLTVDIHPLLLPAYWGTGESHKLEEAIEDWLKVNTTYCKVMIQTPQCCREVLKAAVREGYSLEGILTAAILWRDKVENVVLMSKFLNRSN